MYIYIDIYNINLLPKYTYVCIVYKKCKYILYNIFILYL